MMAKLGHTPYTKKQIVELAITSLATSTMSRVNYVCIESQNDPILHEHVIQGLYFGQGTTCTCSSIHTHNKELLSHLNHLDLCIT